MDDSSHWLESALASCVTANTVKLTALVYQCNPGLAAAYLADTLQPVAQIPVDNDCVHLRPQHWLYHQYGSLRLATEISQEPQQNMEQPVIGSDVINKL